MELSSTNERKIIWAALFLETCLRYIFVMEAWTSNFDTKQFHHIYMKLSATFDLWVSLSVPDNQCVCVCWVAWRNRKMPPEKHYNSINNFRNSFRNEWMSSFASEAKLTGNVMPPMAKSNVQESCSGLILAVKCLSKLTGPLMTL